MAFFVTAINVNSDLTFKDLIVRLQGLVGTCYIVTISTPTHVLTFLIPILYMQDEELYLSTMEYLDPTHE